MTLTACLFKYIRTMNINFWINLHKRSLICYMLPHFITQCLKYMLLYSIETVIDQYLQLILQCYFNGHAVAPLVVTGTFVITGFWLTVTSWGLCSINYLGSLTAVTLWKQSCTNANISQNVSRLYNLLF